MRHCVQFTQQRSGTKWNTFPPQGKYLHCSTGTVLHTQAISWHGTQVNTGTLRHRVRSVLAQCMLAPAAQHRWSALCAVRDGHSKAEAECWSPECNQPANRPASHASIQETKLTLQESWQLRLSLMMSSCQGHIQPRSILRCPAVASASRSISDVPTFIIWLTLHHFPRLQVKQQLPLQRAEQDDILLYTDYCIQ